MGPCLACDYVDVFMGVLDDETVSRSPVPLLSSLLPKQQQDDNKPRMQEGHQAEQTTLEENTPTSSSDTKKVEPEMSRDQAEQHSEQKSVRAELGSNTQNNSALDPPLTQEIGPPTRPLTTPYTPHTHASSLIVPTDRILNPF